MDLSKCFDTLDHEIIIKSIRRRVTDGSILNLVRMFLTSGIMENGSWQASTEGSPQGGVISPLIANIYIDAFDQFMMQRRHRIVRYADDILILKRSEKAAEHARELATEYLEGTLKLTVNRKKTHITSGFKGVKFLGVKIYTRHTSIQEKKVEAFKEKVRKITGRSTPGNLEIVIKNLNPVTRGFANYFRIADCKVIFRDLARWIRRRLRAKQLALWKRPGRLHRHLRSVGYKGKYMKIKMKSWRNSNCIMAHYALQNDWFEQHGLFDISKVQTRISVQLM